MTFEEFKEFIEVRHETVHNENQLTDTYFAYAVFRLQRMARETVTNNALMFAELHDNADGLTEYMKKRVESVAVNGLWVDVCDRIGIAHAATGDDTDRYAECVRRFAKEILPVIKESHAYNEVDYMAFLHSLRGLGIMDDAYYEECVNDVFA